MIVLHLRLRVAPERRAELIEFLRAAVPVYEAPGGIHVRLLERQDVRGEFLEIVEYDSDERYVTDQRRIEEDPQMRELLERWRGLLDGRPEVETFLDISSAISPGRG